MNMQTNCALSFLDATIRAIYPQDYAYRQLAENRFKQLTLPQWALGDLINLAIDLAGMTQTLRPSVVRKKVVVMVGDHGVSAEEEAGYPDNATAQMVHALVLGETGINALAQRGGAMVCVVDVGAKEDFAELARDGKLIAKKIGHATATMVYGPAMTRTHAVMSVEAGIEVANQLAAEVDVFGVAAIGSGSTASSIALAAVFADKKVENLIGRGIGLDDTRLQHKISLINKALARNRPDAKDGLDVLAKVGGFEIGAIAGLIIGAAAKRKPVVVDSFCSTAGAMIACSLEPFVRDYIICAQRSIEPGHGALLDKLQHRPLFDLNLPFGEGAATVLALHMVEAAGAILAGMASEAEVGDTEVS
jgi:nicotinate-nucleotide--dimethylbenzimidazole phosphoribosyltransferase